MSLRLARAYDSETTHEAAFRRALTPAAKFWVCKRGCELAAEAMEVLGGNGYTEDFPLARIAREMPVNSIWEGSGNIMCLDVLRAFAKSSQCHDAVAEEFSAARGLNVHFDAAFERFQALLIAGPAEQQARHFSQLFVTLAQAALLMKAGNDTGTAAEAFCATRLCADSGWGAVFGAGDTTFNEAALLDRAWPEPVI